MQGKDLRNYIPFMGVASLDDDCIVSKRGDVIFGWRLYLPVAYTVNEAGYDSIINSFKQAYRLLPEWCVVHKQDIFRNDTYHAEQRGEFLLDCYEKHFEGRRYLNGYSYLYLVFSSKSVIEAKSSESGYFRLLSAKPLTTEYIRKVAGIASQFESVLSNNPLLTVEPMKASDFIRPGEHGEDCGVIPEYLRMFSDEANLDYPLAFDESYVRCGDTIMKGWFVEDSDAYPAMVNSVCPVPGMSSGVSQVLLSGGSPIGYQLKIPHIVNRYVLTLPRKSVEKELERKKKLNNSFSLYSAACRVNAEELEMHLDVAAREGSTDIKCFTDVLAWGRAADIPDIRNMIVTAFTDLDMTVCEELTLMPVLHYASIPGAAAELGYEYYMTSEMNGFLCHGLWDGYDFGVRGGAIKINDRRRMVPMRVDTQIAARDQGYITDMNMLVVGPSGTGKSFTTNHLVNNFYVAGEHGLIIDVGDSYQGLFQVINEESGGKDGIYNTYDPDNPLSFNPFKGRQHWDERDEEGNRVSSGYDYLMSLLQTMYEPEGGWKSETTSFLDKIIDMFFTLWDNGYDENLSVSLKNAFVNYQRRRAEKERKKFNEETALRGYMDPLPELFSTKKREKDPVFDDFFRFVSRVIGPLLEDENLVFNGVKVNSGMLDINAFSLVLEKFSLNGKYGFFLNAETEKDLFSSRLTCYEVDQIKDNAELFPLWILTIIHSFEEKMRTLQCPKFIVIEEAWSAIAKPTMANFIVWLWRTARKFRTSAIVVTQSLFDLTGSDIIKDAIINNTSTKIMLDQSKNAGKFEASAEVLAFSPGDVGMVLSINKDLDPQYGKYKEVFFGIGPQYCNVFALEVSLEQALAYESEKPKKQPLLDLAKKEGSIIRAIEIMAERIRKGNN